MKLENEKKNYYLGLDIGTNSVGAAAADENYDPIKHKGEPIWVSHLFDEGKQCSERRSFRTARRRLDRRQQRVQLIDEIFAPEVAKVDEGFYIRKQESALWREDKTNPSQVNMYFNDKGYTDTDYHREYPTIHHLIMKLMEEEGPFDIRMVNIAVDWLVAHRGHFLSEIRMENVDKITDFSTVYEGFIDYLDTEGLLEDYYAWKDADREALEKLFKQKSGITAKKKGLKEIVYGAKIPKNEELPYKPDSMVNFLAGGKIKAKDLFQGSEYEDDFSFSISDDMEEILPKLGDDADFVSRMIAIYDWSVLSDILKGEKYLSQAKINIYNQHAKDLKQLKAFVRKYVPDEYYHVFKDSGKELKNYTAYSYNLHSVDEDKEAPKGKASLKDFTDFLKKSLKLKDLVVEDDDREFYEDMMERIELGEFMPKQVYSDNRVIPHQLYEIELMKILEKAQKYLPFLNEKDEDGYVIKDKILSVFTFRIPYYVGPLRKDNGEHAWIERKKDGKIYPWNFDELVDRDESEKQFINRMTNSCTYLPGEKVLPKWSLVYSKFMVLNEINNLKVNGQAVSVKAKQRIYKELFEKSARVTVKRIRSFLEANNYMKKEDTLSGIDISVKASLKAQYEFRRLLSSGALKEEDVERIIEMSTYTEDRSRYRKWLRKEFSGLSEEDIKYVSKLKYKDFGRLSKRLLCGLTGTDEKSGEMGSILYFLWNTNDNFMQLLSDHYDFKKQIDHEVAGYYGSKQMSLAEQLDDMGISNAVKRPITRTLDVVDDIVTTIGHPPARIFVEMARGADESQTGRTKPRKQQLLDLYKTCQEDTRLLEEELEKMGDMANNHLQSEALFLYYLQLGRCAYSGESIDLARLKENYNIDHIYPQSYVKDDSIWNNKVLVKSELNGSKDNVYPVKKEIRDSQKDFWERLHKAGLMGDEKYKRLTRQTGFTEAEKEGFIARQLVETRQSMKAVTQILNSRYPETEIVYVKARLASEFRHKFLTPKSRLINDLHHAKDAYLNLVVGNVYHERFTKKWFRITDEYSVKVKTIFTQKLVHGDKVIWDPDIHLPKVKSVYKKNNVKMTRYAYCQRGGLFDQMPVKAKKDLVPLKKGMDPEKYGGYNKSGAAFFAVAAYNRGGKKEVSFVPIELMVSDRFLKDPEFAKSYVTQQLQNINTKTISDVEFPLGTRVVKFKSVLSLDGYEVWVNGKSSGGRQIIVSSAVSLIVSKDKESYIKKLENFQSKKQKKLQIALDEEHDGINRQMNEELYVCLERKLEKSIFHKMPGCQYEVVAKGKEKFVALSVEEQVTVLLELVILLQAGRAGGCNFQAIGGKSTSGAMLIGAALSSSSYEDIRIVDYSPAGLHRKVSVNLKDFLK